MGWGIDEILWEKVRDEILKENYAGCAYSMSSSFSPVIIAHREKLGSKDRNKISKLFPKWVRVEFQEVNYPGEINTLYGRDDFLHPDLKTNLYLRALVYLRVLFDSFPSLKEEWEKMQEMRANAKK